MDSEYKFKWNTKLHPEDYKAWEDGGWSEVLDSCIHEGYSSSATLKKAFSERFPRYKFICRRSCSRIWNTETYTITVSNK